MHTEMAFPFIPADAPFQQSAVAHAHRVGVNAVELDAISQAITRLVRYHSTVIPATLQNEFREFEELDYIDTVPTNAGTLEVSLRVPGALLSSYFWSVWVPRYLFGCSLKVTVIPCLPLEDEVQHCTVVFRIPGTREASREFLTDLATRYSGQAPEPEIVAIQAGDALNQEGMR
ncbi:putative protein CP11 [Azotobacter vinelandii]|uniref:putative protein CP11 n=1 Tax=Azotobacter vinelandii TaxID=354 RepID=UPI00091C0E2C|nr:putative protein CP11 [Azotobacter vinelandii]WKN23209.1 hypothetical protein AVAEIV_001246 [Azotobacter vinelandii]SFY07897.1 hypothetical protein SAMN04244547_03887 [Azotobacter vinelandii]